MKPGSKGWKLFMAKLYGFGAAVVIVGALFKIQHWPGAGPMLVLGLSTEALIFIFSAFEPPHEDPDWSLVYPELAGMHGDHGHAEIEEHKEEPESIVEELDNLLEDAKIDSDLISSLGTGLRSLSESTSKLSNISDASVATNEYVSNVRNASSSVKQLTDNYAKASEALTGLSMSNDAGKSYGESLQAVSKNLEALNSVYELQLKGSKEHADATNKLYSNIQEMMENLSASVNDTKKYRESIAELSQNLTALNTVYGNMLSAMNYKG